MKIPAIRDIFFINSFYDPRIQNEMQSCANLRFKNFSSKYLEKLDNVNFTQINTISSQLFETEFSSDDVIKDLNQIVKS